MPARRIGIWLWCIACFALVGCGSSSKPENEKISLKLNLTKGENRKMSIESTMNMMGKGSSEGAKVSMDAELSLGVIDINDDGLHVLTVKYDRLAIKMTGMPRTTEYDTSKPEEGNPYGKVMQPFVGQEFRFNVTPAGKTTVVGGFDELADKLAASSRGNKDNFLQQLAGTKDSFDQSFAWYPPRPVAIGDTWTSVIRWPSNPTAPIRADIQCRLDGRKEGKAIIKVDGTVGSSTGITGTLSGTIIMDEQSGWTDNADLTMNMGSQGRGGPMDMAGVIKIKGT